MNYEKRARDIFEKKLKAKVLSISEPGSGNYNKVFIVQTSKGEFVIRFVFKDKYSLKAHEYALKKWAELKVPVPKILFTGKDYAVETRIQGNDWRNSEINPRQTAKALNTLGKFLRKMHSVKTKKYGYIIRPGIGQHDSWKEFMNRYLAARMSIIRKTRCLNRSQIMMIQKFLDNNKDILEFDSPRLCHKDLNKGNIMIHNGRISGIIDASDAISGDPMLDVGIIYQKFGEESFKDFSRTYGKIDMRKAKYYAVVNALRKISLEHSKGNIDACTRNYNQIEDILIGVVG